ncbi:MAG: 16S rRNA (cytidine(1402)-2'-O)-methyltransferase [Desulfobacter sp.]|nr:MAG: 16S rRNA (cytidine(1402)-2'-O)-methyltransferase [Desulfobacter sp.]
MAGTLYIVATPMGNLEDITFRALRILKEVDLIAAEDTRHSRRLLDHYGITTPMTACHEHNEDRKSEDILDRIVEGLDVALISDAGTPLISDPGYRLVNRAAAREIKVVPIPGCNAAVTGLSASGLPTDSFLFCGFPPKKQKAQEAFLDGLAQGSATLILYESPKRIKKLISRAVDRLGDRHACLAREMTKHYEEFLRAPLSKLLSDLEDRDQIKGECVLFIQGAGKTSAPPSPDSLEDLIRERLKENPKTSALAKELAGRFNLPRKQVYDAILALKKSGA